MEQTEEELSILLSKLSKAHQTLKTALSQEINEFVRDAAIQRFEYTFELCWKTIKKAAYLNGEKLLSLAETIRYAGRIGWIEDANVWFKFLDARNRTPHTYEALTAEAVFETLPSFNIALDDLEKNLVQFLKNFRRIFDVV